MAGRQHTHAQRQLAEQRLLAGEPAAAVSRDLQLSERSVVRWRDALGVAPKPRGFPRGKARKMTSALQPLAQHEKVRHFRQRGMIWAFDAVLDDAHAATSFPRRFFASALKHELLLRPIGRTVYLMPPYILDDEEIMGVAARMHTVFEEVIA